MTSHQLFEPPTPATRTLERGLRILDVLKDRGPSTLTEIAQALQLDKSTAHRLLRTMVNLLFVEREPEGTKYRLAVKLVEHGRRVIADMELHRVALPHLHHLREAAGESANLAVLHGGAIVWVATLEGRSPLRMTGPAGVGAGQLHSTASGKAILAFLPDGEVGRLLANSDLAPSTSTTIATVEALREELRRTRDRGYALDDMENIPGLRCIAVPVFGPSDQVLGAISVSAPALRFTQEAIRQVLPVLIEVGLDVSRTMGADERTLMALMNAASVELAG